MAEYQPGYNTDSSEAQKQVARLAELFWIVWKEGIKEDNALSGMETCEVVRTKT